MSHRIQLPSVQLLTLLFLPPPPPGIHMSKEIGHTRVLDLAGVGGGCLDIPEDTPEEGATESSYGDPLR